MNKLLGAVLFGFALITVGCSTAATVSQSRPDSYYKGVSFEAGGIGEGSLFSSDNAILSDEDVKKILAFKFKPQPLNRIAVLPMGQVSWYGWSDELDKAGDLVQNTLINKLRQAPAVYDAAYLPMLLVPEKKTIGYLREAAARFQSDLLFIYKASFRTYEKYKLFSPDQSKAYCRLEAVVVDTRTGIVPFTMVINRAFTAERNKTDMNFYETIRKAQLTALGSALSEVGDEVVNFLSHAAQ